jgi:enamine deaminase RidA (YjgF/YER057c/UK114 family)
MPIEPLAVLAAALMLSATAAAQAPGRIPLTASQNPANADIPFSQAVWVGDTLYVSGWLDPDRKTHPDTRSQTVGILQDMRTFLATQRLTLGDVVMMREFIQNDPARDATADILGARAGYAQFFGTRDQPNRPASTALRVGLPSAGSGALLEIDVIAVRPTAPPAGHDGG